MGARHDDLRTQGEAAAEAGSVTGSRQDGLGPFCAEGERTRKRGEEEVKGGRKNKGERREDGIGGEGRGKERRRKKHDQEKGEERRQTEMRIE